MSTASNVIFNAPREVIIPMTLESTSEIENISPWEEPLVLKILIFFRFKEIENDKFYEWVYAHKKKERGQEMK